MWKILFGTLFVLFLAWLAVAVRRRARRIRHYNETLMAARAQRLEVRQTAEVDYVIHQIDEQLLKQAEDPSELKPRLEEIKSVILRSRNVRPSELSLDPLCAAVVRACRERARNGEILYSPAGGGSLRTMGDEESLHWALKELLSNVFAHAGEWSTIVLKLEPSNGAILLSVHDDGSGPDLATVSRLYSAFTARLGSGGPGLGLFAVRHIVESMGGSIQAKPGDRGGLVHTVRLPADPARGAEIPPSS